MMIRRRVWVEIEENVFSFSHDIFLGNPEVKILAAEINMLQLLHQLKILSYRIDIQKYTISLNKRKKR